MKGCILADDMGLGKSLSSLIAAKTYSRVCHTETLVISPKSVMKNWENEAKMAGTKVSVHSWGKIPDKNFLPFVLIADEAHYAQNYKSKRAKDLIALAQQPNCMATYLLSGTPIKNGRPINLYPLLLAINSPIVESKNEYEVRYCGASLKRFRIKDVKTNEYTIREVWDTTGATNLPELHERLKPHMLRRLKKDCLNLPPKIRTLQEVELDEATQLQYDTTFKLLRSEWKRRLDAGEIKGTGDVLVLLNNLRMAGSLAKVNTTIEKADEVLEQGNQIVLFTEFVESAQQLADYYKVPCLTGSSSKTQRQAMVDDFQSGKNKVFAGTIKAGGVGITLTRSQDIILVDRPWTPGDAVQAEDRLHRIGQNGTVSVTWLQHGNIDQKIDGILEVKMKNIGEVLHGTPDSLSFDEVKALAEDIFEF
jgi:SNF2 family DNA or RNA helicase